MVRRIMVMMSIGVLVFVSLYLSCTRHKSPPNPDTHYVPSLATEEVKNIAVGNNKFAFELYAKLREKEKGNLIFSPYSISTAFAMLYAGTRGNTAKQIKDVFHFTLPDDRLNDAYSWLIGTTLSKEGYTLDVANGIWLRKGFPFLREYVELVKTKYQATVDELKNETEINRWVAQKTRDKIKELFQEGSITDDTVSVLVNAIYFKGDWKFKFDKEMTKPGDFHISAEEKVETPMMRQKGTFRYLEDRELRVRVLELPFMKEEISMIILLPDKIDGLKEVESKISVEKLEKIISSLNPVEDITVVMPRFKIKSNFSMNETLQAMGAMDAFVQGIADFTGMSPKGKMMFISKVVHEAVIEVSEEGAEVAAATGIPVLGEKSVSPSFVVDHPFMFSLRDNRTGMILFLGSVVDPR